MKTVKNSIVVATLFLLFSPAFYAQNSIQGTVANWSNGEVPLLFDDYVSPEKITMGTITSDGNITIPLDDNYLSKMKEAAAKAKEKAPQGWEMKFNTVESSFGCSDEGIAYENAATIFSGLPDLEAVSKDGTTPYGYLYCTNNPQLSTWLYNYGQGNIAKGYYLRWFFAEDNASVKGSCNMPTYTGNDDENYMDTTIYDLQLKKGWNIIKYAITETFTSQTGKITPAKTEITKIDAVPADAQWLLLSN
jgi:hypothetical protein